MQARASRKPAHAADWSFLSACAGPGAGVRVSLHMCVCARARAEPGERVIFNYRAFPANRGIAAAENNWIRRFLFGSSFRYPPREFSPAIRQDCDCLLESIREFSRALIARPVKLEM